MQDERNGNDTLIRPVSTAVLNDSGTIEAVSEWWRESIPRCSRNDPARGDVGDDYIALFRADPDPQSGQLAQWLAGVGQVLDGRREVFELRQGIRLGDRVCVPRATRLPLAGGRVLLTVIEGAVVETGEDGAFGGGAAVCNDRDMNQREHQGEALQQAHRDAEVFGRMIELASQAIGSADLDGRVLYQNPAMRRLLGVPSLEAARQHNYEDFYQAEELQRLRQHVIPIVLSEGHWTGEIALRPLYGEPVPTIQSIYLLRDGQGRPFALSSVVADITEQKSIERALRASEAKYRQLFEEALDGIALADVETGVLIDCNEALCRMSGRSREELIGQPQRILHPPEARGAALTANFELHRSGRHAAVRDDRLLTAAGEIRDVEIKANLVDLNGRKVLQGLFRDVTERKRAEAALEQRIVALTQPLDAAESIAFEDLLSLSDVQRLQDLFAQAFGVASLITTPDGTPITRPSNFCDLCAQIIRTSPIGLKNCNRSDAAIGRHNPSGPNVQACLSAGLCNAGASITVGGRHVANWLIGQVRSEAQDENEIVRYAREIGADEAAFRAAYRRVPVMSQQQFDRVAQVLFAVANQISTSAYQNVQQARFIAERKRAEEALKELNATLERRVKEVVAKDREKDHLLIQQSRLAAMGEMIGNIAHQWRQPINALALLLANLKDARDYGDLDDDYLNTQVERGHQLIQKMSTTIDDFRNFFKPNRERQAFLLSAIVRDSLSIVESAFAHHRIGVEVVLASDATVLGFPNEYSQVLLNLLSNAKDAIEARGTEDGKVRITVDRSGSEAWLVVSDNGGGMPADVVPRIFDPYFTTRDGGTGIGLYMSKMIIETNMRGRIEARNSGEGAEFQVVTPIAQPVMTDPAPVR